MTIQIFRSCPAALRALSLCAALAAPQAWGQRPVTLPRMADYIVAVVNQESVTASELQQRVQQARKEASERRRSVPSDDELRSQMLQSLIDERVQITYARDSGQKVDEGELDRAVANVAAQNQLTLVQLRDRLRAEGIDYARFRSNIRDQMMLERVREREVQPRVKVSDADIDAWINQQRQQAAATLQYNIAQVFVPVPEGADERVRAERRAQAEAALVRVRRGEAFERVAAEVSQDRNSKRGGELGLRPASALPDLFVQAVASLKPGAVAPVVVESPAGYHLLKLIDQAAGEAFVATQTRSRHILMRASGQAGPEASARRLKEIKAQIASGQKTFAQAAREHSQDGSAPQGGELGWVLPGGFVPEFEEVMNALAIGEVSDPVQSRFGTHLIEVLERRQIKLDAKQQREQARAALREQKLDEATAEWVRDLRARAYVELREAPQ